MSRGGELPGGEPGASILDAVDRLLERGVVTTGDVVLGLADVDLVYLQLSALLCAADRVLPSGRTAGGGPLGRADDGGPPAELSETPPAGSREPQAPASPEADRAAAPPSEAARPAPAPPPVRRAAPAEESDPNQDDDLHPLAAEELETLRGELEERLGEAAPARWNANPEDAQRALAKLVLTVADFIRQLLERQAIRRMDAGNLTADEVERVGLALMRLEETLYDMAARFGIPPEELNLDLGPLGRLT